MTPIEVSSWEPAEQEPLGTKPKQWLRDPDGVLWLWKRSTMQADHLHGAFRKGDDWAEVIAAGVGRALGVPVATVRLATRGEEFGVVSRKVVDESETLVHGNEMLAGVLGDGRDPRDRSGYTVAAVARVLEGVGSPVESDLLAGAFDWFVGYLVLDALIGNTDRHQDNWATIRASTGWRLAPSFDHASCLGFQLSDQERAERLTSRGNRSVESYASQARSKFDGGPSPMEAATTALRLVDVSARVHWCRAVEQLQHLGPLVQELPDDRMSAPARDFASALLAHNHSALSYRLRNMAT